MKNTNNFISSIFIILSIIISGCTGQQTFGTAARAGDTIAMALGYQLELTRQDVEVSITDSLSNTTVYPPGNPAVRALYQSYPDPISNLIVGGETGQNGIGGSLAGVATTLIDASITGGSKDYSQTFMLLDLPAGMQAGTATITLTDPLGSPIVKPTVAGGVIDPMDIEIVVGSGSPNTFQTQDNIILIDGYLKAMERSPHYTITIEGSTVPYAVELNFTHDPDLDNGGTGKAYVSSPRGDLNNISWKDDGTNLKVIQIPSKAQTPGDIKQFKFYIAGGVTGLVLAPVDGITAFDVNGATVAGITATLN